MLEQLEPMAVSTSEAARLLGVSKPKLYQLMCREDFPSFKLDGRTLVSVDGLREWVRNQSGGKTGGACDPN